jgi:hypothetical protein
VLERHIREKGEYLWSLRGVPTKSRWARITELEGRPDRS